MRAALRLWAGRAFLSELFAVGPAAGRTSAPRERLGHLRDHLPHELAIRRVARLDGDEMSANRPASQRKVAHNIQHFVPDKFLRVTQRLGRQHRVVPDDYGVLQTAAFDEAILKQIFNLLEKTKRPRVRQFLFPRCGRNFRAVKLGEAALLVRAGAGDLETVVGKQRHHRFARLHFNRLGRRERFALLRLRHDAGRLDDFAKLARAAVGDGRSFASSSIDRVVHAVAGQRGENVFDRVDFTLPLASVVERFVSLTFSTRASISGLPSRSTRRKRTPLLAGAGRMDMLTRLPLWRPVPEKVAGRLSVC